MTDDIELVRERLGKRIFEMTARTIILTIKVVAPDQLEDGPAKVFKHLADLIRKQAH